jgi:hypothetical protein
VYAHENNDSVLDEVEVRVLVELQEKGDDWPNEDECQGHQGDKDVFLPELI